MIHEMITGSFPFSGERTEPLASLFHKLKATFDSAEVQTIKTALLTRNRLSPAELVILHEIKKITGD